MSTGKHDFGDIFAERLHSLMKAQDITQIQIAQACGVGQSAVSKWLDGGGIGALEFYRLAKFLGVPQETLMGIENSPKHFELRDRPDVPTHLLDELLAEAQEIIERGRRIERITKKIKPNSSPASDSPEKIAAGVLSYAKNRRASRGPKPRKASPPGSSPQGQAS